MSVPTGSCQAHRICFGEIAGGLIKVAVTGSLARVLQLTALGAVPSRSWCTGRGRRSAGAAVPPPLVPGQRTDGPAGQTEPDHTAANNGIAVELASRKGSRGKREGGRQAGPGRAPTAQRRPGN